MPQSDIVKHLNKHRGRRFTAAQLSKELNLCRTAASCSVAQLVRFRMVKSAIVREPRVLCLNGKIHPYKRQVRKIWR